MKKLMLGLLAAFLMSAGFVAVGSVTTPASAVCGNPTYPACFDTTTGLTVRPFGDGPKRRTFTATVAAVNTTAKPTGVFVFRFKRVGGGAQFATRAVPSNGKVVLSRTFKASGIWNVTVRYQPKAQSVFKGSKSGNRQFRVGR